MLFSSLFLLSTSLLTTAQLTSSSIKTFVNSLELDATFDPVMPAYWTNIPRHRRTPLAVSPNGKVAYLAYLSSDSSVHVQSLDPTTFNATGTSVSVSGGREAGGLVAHDDGFALLTSLPVTGTNAPPENTPVPVLIRYDTTGKESWRTFLAGPGVHPEEGLMASPDMNGDLVFSTESQLYGAYFVVTAYSGWAEGHFGDSIQYIDTSGTLQTIPSSSAWGCSHNTGIALEPAAAPPFVSICAEDHGSIWLNTATRGMSGAKIAGENTTNGASGEPMGGMSGSYSSLARLGDSDAYLFAWRSRGCVNLRPDEWLGGGNTQCDPRSTNGHVAIAPLASKTALAGKEAISQAGAASGDEQLQLLTSGTADHSNVHVAAFGEGSALVTWEEISDPSCTDVAMGCSGSFSGSGFLEVDANGKVVGEPVVRDDVYVAGDIVTVGDRLCWPFVSMEWSLGKPAWGGQEGGTVGRMSFGCVAGAGAGAGDAGAGDADGADDEVM